MNSIRLDNGKQPDDDLFLFLYETLPRTKIKGEPFIFIFVYYYFFTLTSIVRQARMLIRHGGVVRDVTRRGVL